MLYSLFIARWNTFYPTRVIELSTKKNPTDNWKVADWFHFWCLPRHFAKTPIRSDKMVRRRSLWKRIVVRFHRLLRFLFFLVFVFLCFLVLKNAHICRKLSWTPKTKPNSHFSTTGLFRFWYSKRFLKSVQKCSIWRWTGCSPKIYLVYGYIRF